MRLILCLGRWRVRGLVSLNLVLIGLRLTEENCLLISFRRRICRLGRHPSRLLCIMMLMSMWSGKSSLRGIILVLRKHRFLDFWRTRIANLFCTLMGTINLLIENFRLGINLSVNCFLSRWIGNWTLLLNMPNLRLWRCFHRLTIASWTSFWHLRLNLWGLLGEKRWSGRENLWICRIHRKQ